MDTLDIISLIHNTYGLVIALKDNILGLDNSKHDNRSLLKLKHSSTYIKNDHLIYIKTYIKKV